MSIANTHRDYSHDWWTPPGWMAWVHETLSNAVGFELGTVFDPYPAHWNPDAWDALTSTWPDAATYANHPGGRGSAQRHWARAEGQGALARPFIWCAFNVEQLRHLRPSPLQLPGWLVMPTKRIGFVWGGPDIRWPTTSTRRHGEVAKSPGNWTVFWSTVQPSTPPVECLVTRTGAAWRMGQ